MTATKPGRAKKSAAHLICILIRRATGAYRLNVQKFQTSTFFGGDDFTKMPGIAHEDTGHSPRGHPTTRSQD